MEWTAKKAAKTAHKKEEKPIFLQYFINIKWKDMAIMNRTHAIRLAFVAGFLLIFLNLIGLRSDIKFDRSPINLSHMR